MNKTKQLKTALYLSTFSLLLMFIAAPLFAASASSPDNIALHKKVTFSRKPNYYLTKDSNDARQITNGKLTNPKQKMWSQKEGVGWSSGAQVSMTIDLGKDEPISGVGIHVSAGNSGGVHWPTRIIVMVSNDGKTFYAIGDLAKLAPAPKINKPFLAHWFRTGAFKTHGRYVKLAVQINPKFFMIDEVQVYRGQDKWLSKPIKGEKVSNASDYLKRLRITAKAQKRQKEDIASVLSLIDQSNIDMNKKAALQKQLAKDAKATSNMKPLKPGFKTIIPITKVHRNILGVHGEALAARGFKPLTLWKVQRYAYRPLIEIPKTDNGHKAQIDLSMLHGAIRSDSVLLTNSSSKPLKVRVQIKNAPSQAKQGWIKLTRAIWTDTLNNEPVQNALMPLSKQGSTWAMTIPAGITGKLWVTVKSSKLQPGDYDSKIVISSGMQKFNVPVHIHVSPVAMGTPKLSLFVWDYTNVTYGGLTKANLPSAIKLMQSHFVNSPWATRAALPTPKAQDFDSSNHLNKKLDFSNLDKWVAKWPHARQYMIFYNAKHDGTFAGAKMGTKKFNERIASWMKQVIAHWKTLGLKPSQLVLLLVDEPSGGGHGARVAKVVPWTQAVKDAAPKVKIFTDPGWHEPEKSPNYPKAFLLADIICPHDSIKPSHRNDWFAKFVHKHNKELYFYNAPGDHPTGDPQISYRQMAWRVFAAGGSGEGFWAFADISHKPTSWNGYVGSRLMFAPVYLDKNHTYNSIHWDAVREGVEDFQVLTKLKNAISKSNNSTLKSKAQNVLSKAVNAVNQNANPNPKSQWNKKTNPFVVDTQINKVRSMLEKIE